MSPLIRRLAPGALLMACALLLAAPPVQARENPIAGAAGSWFEVLAHQVAQWAAGWLTPVHNVAAGQVARSKRSPASLRPPVSVECGGPVDPDGRCLGTALSSPR
jgi:hypothetical protein